MSLLCAWRTAYTIGAKLRRNEPTFRATMRRRSKIVPARRTCSGQMLIASSPPDCRDDDQQRRRRPMREDDFSDHWRRRIVQRLVAQHRPLISLYREAKHILLVFIRRLANLKMDEFEAGRGRCPKGNLDFAAVGRQAVVAAVGSRPDVRTKTASPPQREHRHRRHHRHGRQNRKHSAEHRNHIPESPPCYPLTFSCLRHRPITCKTIPATPNKTNMVAGGHG